MSVLFELSAIEKDIKNGNYNLEDKILNLRQLILPESGNIQLLPKEGKTHALQIWNIAVKLQRAISKLSVPDQSTLRLALIPQLRLLAVDAFEKYMDKSNEDDNSNLLYFLTYAYKSLLDAQNFNYANKLFDAACTLIPSIQKSQENTQSIVQLLTWKVNSELFQYNDYDEALRLLQSLIAEFPIDSSHFIFFVYEKAVQSKSINWGEFCHSLILQSSTVSNEWKTQIHLLLAQLYLNNNDPINAVKTLSDIPDSLNKLYLQLKCSILTDPNDETIKDRLLSFISQTTEDPRVLIALCLFVADHCNNLMETSLIFISEVIKISSLIESFELRKCIYLSSIRIASECNKIQSAESFLQSIKDKDKFSNDEMKEMAGILWNQALNCFDLSDFSAASHWMELSRLQMSDLDNTSQACCFRFISRCYYEQHKFTEAISFVNDAIQRDPSNSHGYLLKFRILKEIGNEKESCEFIYNLIYNSPYLEEFELTFFTSVAAELHSIGNDGLALETLLKSYELNFSKTNPFTEKPSNSNELNQDSSTSIEINQTPVNQIEINQDSPNSIEINQNPVNQIEINKDSSNSTEFIENHPTIQFDENQSGEFNDEYGTSNNCELKKSIINSIFAILQQTEDKSYVSKAINILASRWNSQVFYYISDISKDYNLIRFTRDDISAYTSISFNNGLEFKNKGKYGKAAKSFMAGAIFSCTLIELKAPCIFQAVDCYIKASKINFDSAKIDISLNSPNQSNNFDSTNVGVKNSPICKAQQALNEISFDDLAQVEQKYKDGYILTNLKLSLVLFSQQNNNETEITNHLIELIDDITSPAILSEICDFICDHKAPLTTLHALLERAKKIDEINHENLSITASLLHQLVLRSQSLSEMKKTFDLVLEFFNSENAVNISSSQLQFFMARAWNIGVQNVKAFRFNDGEWWLKTALHLLSLNEELKNLYEDELNMKYANFLEHQNRPIFLPF